MQVKMGAQIGLAQASKNDLHRRADGHREEQPHEPERGTAGHKSDDDLDRLESHATPDDAWRDEAHVDEVDHGHDGKRRNDHRDASTGEKSDDEREA